MCFNNHVVTVIGQQTSLIFNLVENLSGVVKRKMRTDPTMIILRCTDAIAHAKLNA